MTHERERPATNVIRVVGLALAVATLAWTFRDAERGRIAELLSRVGAAGMLIVLPQFLALLAEAVGWRLAFDGMGARLTLFGLFRVRLATEALAQTLPIGVVFCESMKPPLLARACGADLSTSLAGMAARKWLLVASQSAYVLGFVLAAWSVLSGISKVMLGVSGLPVWLLGAGLLLAALAFVSCSMLAHGRVATKLHALLSRLPLAWVKRRLRPLEQRFAHTDGRLERFFSTLPRSPYALVAFLMAWLLEAVDTFLILYLLGVRLPWTTLGALEVSSSLLRNVAFVVPAGLGVQDISYVAFLKALHVSDALNVAAAFLLLKRGKECFWAVCGYTILALEWQKRRPAMPLEQAC